MKIIIDILFEKTINMDSDENWDTILKDCASAYMMPSVRFNSKKINAFKCCFMETLGKSSERGQEVIKKYYGIGDSEKKSFAEIAAYDKSVGGTYQFFEALVRKEMREKGISGEVTEEQIGEKIVTGCLRRFWSSNRNILEKAYVEYLCN